MLWRVNVAGMARVLKAAAPHLGEGVGGRQHRQPDGAHRPAHGRLDVRRVEGRR